MIERLRFYDERDWFQQKRLGMFVHWGIYSLTQWHEQALWRGRMKRSEYELLAQRFNPARFSADEWIDVMEMAGMEYMCFTSKHHDGFCMWNTDYSNYNIMNTPFGKDIVAMLSEACGRRGIGFGLYYSIPDWHHRNYPNQGRHHEMPGPRTTDEPNQAEYCRYMENQLVELMTNYGTINQLFWDVNVINYNNRAFNDRLRALQPSMVINDRGPDNCDFVTPEREVPQGMEFPRLTEAVQSVGRESWGYKADEDYYRPSYLISSIDKTLAMGGNYLLNVGPRPDGAIDERDIAILSEVGGWYKRVKEAFEGTVPATTLITQSVATMRDPVLLTRKGNTVYVHLYNGTVADGISLKPFDALPQTAVLLNTGEPLDISVDLTPAFHLDRRPFLRVRNLPEGLMAKETLILKLEFDNLWGD